MKPDVFRLCLECLTGGVLLFLAGVSLIFAQSPSDPVSSPRSAATTPILVSASDAAPDNADALPRGDRRFFKQAARLGEQEAALSRIASERARLPQVRAFAAEMAREYTTANEELSKLTFRKGVVVEPLDRSELRGGERKWIAKKVESFDEDYLEAIIDAHQDTLDVLENGADSADPEIAAYANKMLPTVKARLARAIALKDAVK